MAAYTSNGHNAAEAARTAGYHPEYGRKCKELPYVKAAIARTLEGMTLGMAAWEAALPWLQMRLLELARSPNEKVALGAVIEGLNRALGKPVAHVQAQVEVEETTLDTAEMRYAIALAFS